MAVLKIPNKSLTDNFSLQDLKDDLNALNASVNPYSLWDAVSNGVKVGDNDNYADQNTTIINQMLADSNCPGVYLPLGVIKSSGLRQGPTKALIGASSKGTILKPKTGQTVPIITLTNGYGARIRDLQVYGNRSNTTCDGIYVTTNNPTDTDSNFQMQIRHVLITQCGKTGLRMDGSKNWVWSVDDVMISLCNEYGLECAATDNTFSNMYISACAKAGALIRASNNKFSNFKCDWSGWSMTNQTTSADGANLIVSAGRCSFSNLDCQQGHYVGVKVVPWPESNAQVAPMNIVFHGSIDSNGVNTAHTPTTGIYFYQAKNISGNLAFDDINGVKCQTTSVKTESNCSNIRIVGMGSTTGTASNSVAGTNCSVITS